MQITAFNGSPAGRNSASNRIITAFLQGAKQAGAEVACYQLAEYQIRQCQGCFACWFKTPGRCVQADDMPELLQAYQAADVVCLPLECDRPAEKFCGPLGAAEKPAGSGKRRQL